MIWWIIGGIVALLCLRSILKFRRFYRLNSPKHYTEFAISLAYAVSAARKDMKLSETDKLLEDDPRYFSTTAGMWLYYKIDQQDGLFQHSFLFGMKRGRMSRLIGEIYTIYAAKLLGVSFKRMKTGYSILNMFHNTFFLTPAQQRRFDKRIMPIYPVSRATDLFKECERLSKELKCEYVPMDEE